MTTTTAQIRPRAGPAGPTVRPRVYDVTETDDDLVTYYARTADGTVHLERRGARTYLVVE